MRVSARPYPDPLEVTLSRTVPDDGLQGDIIRHQDSVLESIDKQILKALPVISSAEDLNREFTSVNDALAFIIDQAALLRPKLDDANRELSIIKERNGQSYHCTTDEQRDLAIAITTRLKRAIKNLGVSRDSSKNFSEAYAVAKQICEAIEALIPPIDLTTDNQTNQQ